METDDLAETPDDDSLLILRARDGDSDAYAELYKRHHKAALNYARSIAGASDADDLVSEAFTKLLSALGREYGPVTSFRPYLLTTIRRLWANTLRSRSRVDVRDEVEDVVDLRTPDRPASGPQASQSWGEEAIGEAFRQLPERWREVLWLSNVDGYSQVEVARHLNIKANAVAALNFRAREGLRREYLAQHLATSSDHQCRETLQMLPSFVRESLDAKRVTHVTGHLATCASCGSAAANLRTINENLGILLPAVATAGLLAPTHISAESTVPATPGSAALRTGSRVQARRVTYGAAAAVAAGLLFLLWPAGATPSAKVIPPIPTPTPQVQVIDLGVIPTPRPRQAKPRSSPSVQPARIVPTQPAPTPPPPPPGGGGGTTVSGTTGGGTPATVSASAS